MGKENKISSKKLWAMLVILFVLFSVVISLNFLREQEMKCRSESDCVPASCCHASECVPIEQAPNCEDVMCTMECRPGTMDCGQGYCACVKGECKAIIKNSI